MTAKLSADVLIVGTGPVGCVYARVLASAGLRVVMVEAGAALSGTPGGHLRNSHLARADPASFHEEVVTRLRPFSVAPSAAAPLRDALGTELPRHLVGPSAPNVAQISRENLPGAATVHGLGGAGTLWSCVAPRLHPEIERWNAYDTAEWERLYGAAERMLHVGTETSAGSVRQAVLIDLVRSSRPGLSPVPAPVAGRPRVRAPRDVHWTGSADILAPALSSSPAPTVLAEHVAVGLRHRGGRVSSALVRCLDSSLEQEVEADVFVVACGGILGPRLLWASGVGRDRGEHSAVGRWLHEHPLAFGQIVAGPEFLAALRARTGIQDGVPVPAGDPEPVVQFPVDATRRMHGLVIQDGRGLRRLEGRVDPRIVFSLYWYAAGRPDRANRVSFDSPTVDVFGLPVPTFHHRLDDDDRRRLQAAIEEMRAVGSSLGAFLPASPPQILPSGSSMHFLGTARMGASDDGEHVVDADLRVFGFENLYAAGTSAFPVQTATNPTLTACALAIRSAERIAGGLSPDRAPSNRHAPDVVPPAR